MTRRDKILIIGLMLIALVSYAAIRLLGQGQQAREAEISVDGKTVQRIDLMGLAQQKIISVQGPLGVTVIQVQNGEARLLSSPCPDKICVRMGWIKQTGQSAICIPNHIILRIVTGEDPVDSITR